MKMMQLKEGAVGRHIKCIGKLLTEFWVRGLFRRRALSKKIISVECLKN